MKEICPVISSRHVLKLALVVASIFLPIAMSASLVSAADTSDSNLKEEITISPAVEQISVAPGEMKTGKFTVLNTGEKDFSFIVYARPYSVDTEMYSPNYEDVSARSNLYRWVQFDKTEGSLKPGEKTEINYTVLVPRDAEAGGHYGVLFAETVADKAGDQVVVRNKRVGSIVRLSVSGDIKRSGKLESQSIDWLQTRPPMTTETVISNSGNIDFDVSTKVRVTTVFGREVFSSEADHVVYPGKPRRINIEWQGSSVLGLYHVEQTVDVLGEESKVSSYVLMIPRWALVLLLMAAISGVGYAAYRRLR